MLNFSELKTQVGALLERQDSAMATKIEAWLNEGYRALDTSPVPWMALLRTISFTAISGLDYFITDQEVDRIIDISQRQTPLVIALQRYYALQHRNLDAITTTGNPSIASPAGSVGIKVALPSDGTITAVSSAAGDTTQKVRIRGYDATTLRQITETLSLNGTSTVTSANSYSSTEGYEPRFTKDSDTTGIITIQRASTTIAELSADAREARYLKWKVWPVFSSNLTMYATIKKRIYKLEQNEDTPEIECDNALIYYAFAQGLREKRQMSKADAVFGVVDMNGEYKPGTFMFEYRQLVAKEPQFGENFSDQFIPMIQRDGIDEQSGAIGWQIGSSAS